MTPYKITTLFEYHKEYNPQQFGSQGVSAGQQPQDEGLDAIDVALGGL